MPLTAEDLKGKTSDELISQIVSLSEENEKLKVPAPVVTPDPVVEPKPTTTLAEPSAPVVQTEEVKKLTETVSTQEKRLNDLEKRNADLEKEARESKANLTLSQYEAKGVPNSLIEQARQMMLSDSGEKKFKLSETDKDGKVTVKDVTLSDFAINMLENAPTVKLGESTGIQADNADPNTPQSAKQEEIAKVKKFAEENKVSFRKAFDELRKSGKIIVK